MWNGKNKAITFSYDDGTMQDIRLAELFHKYGLKATFNLNSEKLGTPNTLLREGVQVDHTKIKPEDVKSVYAGHEVAAHTLTHPHLTKITDDAEIIRQVEQDRLNLSELVGYEVVGFAYPGGGINHSPRIAELIRKHTGIKYARTADSNYAFELQNHLLQFISCRLHPLRRMRCCLLDRSPEHRYQQACKGTHLEDRASSPHNRTHRIRNVGRRQVRTPYHRYEMGNRGR